MDRSGNPHGAWARFGNFVLMPARSVTHTRYVRAKCEITYYSQSSRVARGGSWREAPDKTARVRAKVGSSQFSNGLGPGRCRGLASIILRSGEGEQGPQGSRSMDL